MIVKYTATVAAATLRHATPGVQRVVVARTDGHAFFDDAEEGGDGADTAQVVATLGRVAAGAADWFHQPSPTGVVVRTPTGVVAAWPVDELHVLAAVCDETANIALLERAAARAVATLVDDA